MVRFSHVDNLLQREYHPEIYRGKGNLEDGKAPKFTGEKAHKNCNPPEIYRGKGYAYDTEPRNLPGKRH